MKSQLYVKIGQFIKCKRMAQNMSQEELAWRCGITTNSIGRIERAEGEFLVANLFKIFKELNIHLKELEQFKH